MEITDPKGRIRKRYTYDNLMTPFDKLRSLPMAETFLKPGVTFAQLKQQAYRMSDNQAAEQLNTAKTRLFQSIFHRPKAAA